MRRSLDTAGIQVDDGGHLIYQDAGNEILYFHHNDARLRCYEVWLQAEYGASINHGHDIASQVNNAENEAGGPGDWRNIRITQHFINVGCTQRVLFPTEHKTQVFSQMLCFCFGIVAGRQLGARVDNGRQGWIHDNSTAEWSQ